MSTHLVVFAKAPQAGVAKTRLMSALGAQGAADLARRMLQHTLQQAMAAQVGPVELCMSPGPDDAAWAGVEIPATALRTSQGDGDLGQRMARAVERVTASGQSILLMGTDCPALSAARIAEAAQALAHHDAALVPVADGGYVLVGLHAPRPAIFADMAWSTPSVAAVTLQRMVMLGQRVWVGPTLHDIDEPTDLAHVPPHLLSSQMTLNKNGL
ncbi:MAG: TIGR04282 family arsenosugar biosynthesis glycosyltransferase [Rhodoferax sp.]